MNSLHKNALRLTALGALLVLAGCKAGIQTSDKDPDDPDPTVERYAGPGNTLWLLELEDGSDFEFKEYTIFNGTRQSRVSGDYDVLESEFSQFAVTSSDGVSTVAANTKLPAIAMADDLLFVHSWFSSGQLLPLVARGECPTTNFSANWIELATPSDHFANDTDAAFFGHFQYSPTDAELRVTQSYAVIDDFSAQQEPDAIDLDTCTQGIAREGATQAYFADNNTAIIYQGIGTAQQRVWLGLPKEIIKSHNFDGDYIGFWIDNGRVAASRLWNVSMSCTSFECTVEQEIDIEDLSTVGTQTFTIDLTQTNEDTLDYPIDGFVTGTFATAPLTGGLIHNPIACSASDDFLATGDKAFICVGQSANNFQRSVVGVFVAKK